MIMSISRTALSVVPFFATGAPPAVRRLPLSLSRRHPAHPALAILFNSHRAISTDTSTTSAGAGNLPPPGFNAAQAKRPLRQDERPREHAKEAKDTKPAEPSAKQVVLSESPATATKHEEISLPKTDTEEARMLKELSTEQAAAEDHSEKKIEERKKEDKKLTLWQKVKKEVVHYWDGTKLLGTEIKISSKLALKMAGGYELTRREHRQASW